MDNKISKILIVEDDVVFCKMLTRFLSKNGFGVSDAQTAKSAYGILEEDSFDLAILDYRLPDENGIDILKKIKASYPETKVMLITRFSNQEVANEALQEGADAYVSKPIDPKELLEQIRMM
ncbi:response regulator [Lunatibacter salilacus]|uniref:response regulator n=1 Tax=Lunatibacter salilacus TaxID=2483804 RepID=UPI00131AEF56|nr:response regulator [Lunatibacter salilacus]